MSVFIIAEAGVNHNGSLDLAKKLIDEAKKAGANAVKFQTFKAKNLASKEAKQAEYQKKNIGKEESQLEMIKKLELSYDEFEILSKYCKQKGIKFLSTAFDFESIDFLNNLGMDYFKIPSGEITNYPYLVKIAKLNKAIIMSTGMCTMEEIKEAYKLLKDNGAKNITVLHCTTQYPTPFEDVNLNAMLSIEKELNVEIGYSDHTLGIEVPICAVGLGAKIIEKHFTLDKNMQGPDHKASLEPDELKQMVDSIRNIEKALGDGVKKPSTCEIENIDIARKSIVAIKDIKKGELFSEKNLTTKRPGNGINPMRWNEVIGKKAKRDFKEDELIEL